MNVTMELRHDQLTKSGQSTDLDELYQYGIFKLRVQIHHDRSYASQSWCKVSVWKDLAWSEIATYARGYWASETAGGEDGTEGIIIARQGLLNQAKLVLG